MTLQEKIEKARELNDQMNELQMKFFGHDLQSIPTQDDVDIITMAAKVNYESAIETAEATGYKPLEESLGGTVRNQISSDKNIN